MMPRGGIRPEHPKLQPQMFYIKKAQISKKKKNKLANCPECNHVSLSLTPQFPWKCGCDILSILNVSIYLK